MENHGKTISATLIPKLESPLCVAGTQTYTTYYSCTKPAGGKGISSCGLCQRCSTVDDQGNVPAEWGTWALCKLKLVTTFSF